MFIREFLNKYPKIMSVVTIIGVAAAVSAAVWSFPTRQTGEVMPRYFFTTEDTLTGDAAINALFPADAMQVPPFTHNGKPAFRAHVFTCDGGRNKFIAYLERYNDKGKQKIEAAKAKLKPKDLGILNILDHQQNNLEVKKPGPGPWVKATDESKAGEIMAVLAPPGFDDKNLELVDP